ncbi:class F sortase [Streptomyces shenzhenensis]|uniref:Class F sortase n=1 Tax=Streptomyces shenzhenensis TaxID=943815 RepID=A0A3M0HUL7_9ACTN|nr:class F sortase [Streptomyces shenzhenensis]RMB79890.1 class F sortase [Streptomyces shenzhenensis]
MTPLSRRGFAAAALATLLAGCGGPPDRPAATAAQESTKDGATASTGTGAAPRPLARSVPVRLLIPAIDVDTPLLRLGLAADRSVQVPPVTAHDQAGWYRHSPTPGQVGPSVILGHVTVGSYGDGVFRHLARLRRGETVVTRLENGARAEFAVTRVRTVAKAEFPADEVYGDVDRPELRLITCGGPHTGDGYRDNVIVYAALSDTAR